jgi:hypothetical protein
LPFISIGQVTSKPLKLDKLVIDSKKSYTITEGDSITSIVIDTQIMKDKSKLSFVSKKQVSLVVKHAIIGKDVVISGNDSKNNGTDLNLSVNFVQLRSLYIDVSGEDARSSNRHYGNGNGGHVVLSYLSSGQRPQIADKKSANFVSIRNRAGGYTVNPQTNITVLLGQIRSGSGRPLGQLPNGRVYSGGIGRDGKITIGPADRLPD